MHHIIFFGNVPDGSEKHAHVKKKCRQGADAHALLQNAHSAIVDHQCNRKGP